MRVLVVLVILFFGPAELDGLMAFLPKHCFPSPSPSVRVLVVVVSVLGNDVHDGILFGEKHAKQ